LVLYLFHEMHDNITIYLTLIFIVKLDYAFEKMLNEKGSLTKDKFSSFIFASKPESIRNTEVDFLFDLLDYNDDDVIDKGDFKPNSKFN